MSKTLNLSTMQAEQLARILDDIETERAQAAVDARRTQALFATALSGTAFEDGQAQAGIDLRQKAEARLHGTVLSTLQKTHALLDAAQRDRLATLLRTGDLSI